MPDIIPTIQAQKEWENMAKLQQQRAQDSRKVNGNALINQDMGQFSDEEINEAKAKQVSIPSFPLILFSLGVIKDILDYAELSIIGIILSWIVTIIFSVIVFFWTFGKLGFVKKMIIRRLILATLVALIPVANLLPESSAFILWVHFREVKYIRNILQALEKLEL